MIFNDKQKQLQQQTKLDNLIQKVKGSKVQEVKQDLKKLESELDDLNKLQENQIDNDLTGILKDNVQEMDQLKKSLGQGGNSKALLFIFFAIFFSFIPLLYLNSPVMSPLDKQKFYIYPSTPKDLKQINEIVQKYSQQNFYFVLTCFTYLYLFLQSFCIPGPIFLSLIGGALYGRFWGFLLVTFCCSLGSSICYTISYYLARGIIVAKFPKQIIWFKKIVIILNSIH